jgi:hypothetical protein
MAEGNNPKKPGKLKSFFKNLMFWKKKEADVSTKSVSDFITTGGTSGQTNKKNAQTVQKQQVVAKPAPAPAIQELTVTDFSGKLSKKNDIVNRFIEQISKDDNQKIGKILNGTIKTADIVRAVGDAMGGDVPIKVSGIINQPLVDGAAKAVAGNIKKLSKPNQSNEQFKQELKNHSHSLGLALESVESAINQALEISGSKGRGK